MCFNTKSHMTRILSRIIPLVVFLSLSHLAFEAKACTCGAIWSLYEEYHKAAAVFVGKAIAAKDVVVSERDDGTLRYSERVFQFEVVEAFKGVATSQIDIDAGTIQSSCYRGFGIGATYLVYAFRRRGKLESGYCSRTNILWSSASDLHYIRELLRGVPEPRVYGSVVRRETFAVGNSMVQSETPLRGITVLIEGEGKRFEVLTDQRGLYRLDQVPDGAYKARPVLPDGYQNYLWSFQDFTLGSGNLSPPFLPNDQRKTITIDFVLAWNNELHGRLLDGEGTPIKRGKVGVLVHPDPAPQSFEPVLSQYFDGKFAFCGLTPGRYLLSVSIGAPFEDKTKVKSFYYPNSVSLDKAERIEIGINQKLEGKNIQLPAGYILRRITGVLEFPDGKPAPHTSVLLTGSKDSTDEKDAYDTSFTNAQGGFSLQAFVGAEYWIHGVNDSSGKGEPIKIKVEMTNEPLKLVVPFPKP